MRMAVDGRNLQLAHRTGVGNYAAGLAAGLAGLGHDLEVLTQDPGSRAGRAGVWWQALQPRRGHCPAADRFGQRHVPDVFRAAHIHFNLFSRPQRLGGAAPKMVHWTYPLPLHWSGAANIYTVHDLVPLLHPGLTSIDGVRMRRLLTTVLARADHVVTVSEATRREVIAAFGLPPERITNTYQAVDLPPMAAAAAVPEADGSYYVYCGTVEPRKNVRRLLQAHRASGVAAPLLIAGRDGWRASEETAGLLPAAHARRLPWLDRPQLLRLIAGARAMLFPSLAEGFGLPVAEAMALGTPVLTSEGGALAEVAGGAALLVDPLDTAAIAAGIARLDQDSGLRSALAAAGRSRAVLFGRAAYAARLAALLARLQSGIAD